MGMGLMGVKGGVCEGLDGLGGDYGNL